MGRGGRGRPQDGLNGGDDKGRREEAGRSLWEGAFTEKGKTNMISP